MSDIISDPVEEAHIRAGSIRRMAATMKLAIKK
jgi:hypothetical protein